MLLVLGLGAAAEEAPDRSPVLLTADDVTYDEDLGIVVARGHVEVSQHGRVVLADSLTYNQRAKTVTATGNVSLLQPGGEVLFSDYVELTDDLKEGVITNVRLLMAEGSKAAAASGRLTSGNRTELSHAVYSPCKLCQDDPTRAPLWQIKAVKVVHDRDKKTITYHDAWMEVFGVPVVYTPYLSHPDPTLKRKSGFLQPTIGYSDELGSLVHIPYYWVISPDKDATFEPIFTEGIPILAGEYRQLMPNGRLELRGAATIADRKEEENGVEVTHEDKFRGYIDGTGRFDIDKHWRWGFDAQRSTDESFMRLYDFGDRRTLTSRLFGEGFYGRSYFLGEAMAFQGQRFGDHDDENPLVAPNLAFDLVGEPEKNGSYLSLEGDLRSLIRLDGRDSRRASLRGAWTLPYVSPIGEVITLEASLRGDGYWVSGVDPDNDDVDPEGDTFSGFAGRIFPQARVEWRMPFVRPHKTTQEVFEPIFSLIVAPRGGNPGKIPNDDSQAVEFDETHLFDPDRYPGFDRIDSGSRVDYGVKWTLFGAESTSSVFLGQSYSFEDNDFQDGSGLEDQLSDLVGAVRINPAPWLDLLYRVRIDATKGTIERNEAVISAGVPELRLNLSYAQIDSAAGSAAELGSREQVTANLSAALDENWSLSLNGARDIAESRNLYFGGALSYQDECFTITASAQRRFFDDEEIDPEMTFAVTVGFKNLGDLRVPLGSFMNNL